MLRNASWITSAFYAAIWQMNEQELTETTENVLSYQLCFLGDLLFKTSPQPIPEKPKLILSGPSTLLTSRIRWRRWLLVHLDGHVVLLR